MQVDVHAEKKLVCVWLSHADENDPFVQERLSVLYRMCGQQKLRPAVFHSGQDNLQEQILDLLKHNRKLSAEREIQVEKLQSAS